MPVALVIVESSIQLEKVINATHSPFKHLIREAAGHIQAYHLHYQLWLKFVAHVFTGL